MIIFEYYSIFIHILKCFGHKKQPKLIYNQYFWFNIFNCVASKTFLESNDVYFFCFYASFIFPCLFYFYFSYFFILSFGGSVSEIFILFLFILIHIKFHIQFKTLPIWLLLKSSYIFYQYYHYLFF